jgi:uncharacterized phage-associated protein
MGGYSVYDIAEWFLNQESMTNKKLQKMCYYAQAWYCALFEGKVLINDRFEAWVHGPVCPNLYSKYSIYGWNKIDKKIDSINLDEETVELLTAVYILYKDLDGDQLEKLTHSELPWMKQREGLNPYQPSNNEISIEDMRSYYLSEFESAQNE